MHSTFNGDVSSWDVSKVTTMKSMFEGAAAFNGDLFSWDVSKVTASSDFATDSALEETEKTLANKPEFPSVPSIVPPYQNC
jgi:surface protein